MSHAQTSAASGGITSTPSERIELEFENRFITARPGQSIAAALFESGQRVFSRSFKYHRPRGLFCVSGDCPNCLMEVDGKPNVRTCVEPARNGQRVRSQNAWPNLDLDLWRLFDYFDRYLPVGFYYKCFHKPKWLWPIAEKFIRPLAGCGRVDVNAAPVADADVEHLHTDVCVIGGGPAGMAAAKAAQQAGASVLMIERMSRLGGHMLFEGDDDGQLHSEAKTIHALANTRILLNTTAFGLYEGNLIAAFREGALFRIRAKHVIICTGGRQQPVLFQNNDLPGIMLGRGAARLQRLHGVRPGRRATIFGSGDLVHQFATRLASAGVTIAGVVDAAKPQMKALRDCAWPVYSGAAIRAAQGNAALERIVVAATTPNSASVPCPDETLDCDLLCIVSPLVPANELLLQAGVRYQCRDGQWCAVNTVAGVSAAGAAAGTWDVDLQILEGTLRGWQAAGSLGFNDLTTHEMLQDFATRRRAQAKDGVMQSCVGPSRKNFVCLCEDVTEKDIRRAIVEGFDEIETLKRYSTASMGPCQGKMCSQLAIAICADATGRTCDAVGVTTSRPPAVPVEMRVLAAARPHPTRRTPMHDWHERTGARWIDAGLWKRPESYGDPMAEVCAVRNQVGVIDVSTLGKIEVIGPDAVELLERVYLNRWRDLAMQRVRYGVMCTEEGILLDDGVAVRLGPSHFYLTATTGNADAVFQWLELWADTWGMNVNIFNCTSGVAAINLAGPRAREVLLGLTRLDLSTAQFPYLAARDAEIAGVRCRVLRIGFVGELSYEIHCPSAAALELWTALIEKGQIHGIRPFGVEAQRILRLEKGHLIFGIDTDALSNPLESGLGWAVGFEKTFFHGKETLLRLQSRGARARIVGFNTVECNWIPPEGSQVVVRQRPVGRVTSSRFSPTLGRPIGLAWVPVEVSKPGDRFHIHSDGVDREATVVRTPFYDPAGSRQR